MLVVAPVTGSGTAEDTVDLTSAQMALPVSRDF